MKEFQKYTGSTNFYCMTNSGIQSGLLSTSMVYPKVTKSELLFFGLTDGKNFKNNLKGINDNPIQLKCDQSDCDASAYGYAVHPDDDTGLNINIKIPPNSNTRYIKFSYNNKYVFSVRQIQKIMYIHTYKFNNKDSQGNYNDYAYKYNLFLSAYTQYTGEHSEYIKIYNNSIKIKDLLFYYTSNNIDSENNTIGDNDNTMLSTVKDTIGSNGWFQPETIESNGYLCHMKSYSTTQNTTQNIIIQINKDTEMPQSLYIMAVPDDNNENYIMGRLQKTDEIIYSYVF